MHQLSALTGALVVVIAVYFAIRKWGRIDPWM